MGHGYPEFFSVGGNTGETNTFTDVDVESLTGGVFDARNPLQGNNVVRLSLEASIQEAPDNLSRLSSNISSAMGQLGTTINTATTGLGPPKVNRIKKG